MNYPAAILCSVVVASLAFTVPPYLEKQEARSLEREVLALQKRKQEAAERNVTIVFAVPTPEPRGPGRRLGAIQEPEGTETKEGL